MIQLGKP